VLFIEDWACVVHGEVSSAMVRAFQGWKNLGVAALTGGRDALMMAAAVWSGHPSDGSAASVRASAGQTA
jgi:hypothetical protein